ncbi:MAG: hypothetical protein IKU33_03495 [Bacteroidales bacterium]|nr:hypothetical protein [Bacteroidales bacterium]
MKKFIIFSLFLSSLMLTSAHAANNSQGDWKQRIMSEKVAFLTIEMGITPEEAQAFWPVYNQVEKERDEAVRLVFQSFKALEDAVAAGKSEKEVAKLLETYLDALEQQSKIDTQASAKYEKVLSVKKLAKLYVGEEKFRRQQVRRLHVGTDRPSLR